jgi:type 1 glutamine amidotransferase
MKTKTKRACPGSKRALMVWGGWPGHKPLESSPTDFDTPEAREIVRRGLLWAAR